MLWALGNFSGRSHDLQVMQRHLISRSAAAAAVVLAVVLGTAGIASAHVSVSPSSTEQGSFTVLTFRVPNEKDSASTVGVTVTMPAGEPLAFASVKPVPGWTTEVTKAAPAEKVEVEGITVDQVVTQVKWTGGEIKPGEFQEFSISAGPMPKADQLVFTATQTYSDGSVVEWNQPTPASGEEPEHPAPTVQLTAAAAGSDGHGAKAGKATITPISADVATHDDVEAAETRGTVGLVIGVAGLLVAVIALVVASRKKSSGSSDSAA